MQPKSFLILISLLISTSVCSQNSGFGKINKVVIDAGHGGKDPGAVSRDRRFSEKNITLSVALHLGQMIKDNYPETEVIYTRKNDTFIPLDERTEIANRNKADLFISIHVNSVKSGDASGTETFVMGVDKSSSNMEVTKLENSVVVFEDDYTSKYQGFDPNNPESYIIFSLLQNSHLEQSLDFAEIVEKSLSNGPIKKSRGIKQAGFLVLWRATMPSVLIELGFISSSNDLKILNNADAQKEFAQNIFNAFANYKMSFEQGVKVTPVIKQQNSVSIKDTTPQVNKTEPLREPNERYMIQILATTKKIPESSKELKGVSGVEVIKIGNFFKYFTGNYSNFDDAREALPAVRKKFPQSFIVKDVGGEIKMVKE